MTNVLIGDTKRKRPKEDKAYENRGKDWSDVGTSQGAQQPLEVSEERN